MRLLNLSLRRFRMLPAHAFICHDAIPPGGGSGHKAAAIVGSEGRFMNEVVSAAILICAMVVAPLRAYAVPTISGTYYDETVGISCPNSTSCTASFSATPASQYVLLDHLYCATAIGSGTSYEAVVFGIAGTSRYFYIPANQPFVTGGANRLNTFEELRFKIGPGRQAFVQIYPTGASDMAISCTMVGTLSAQ
jgi:hypothetical protein